MTLRKAKAKISPQNRQNSITSQNNSWFYLRTCVRMSVNPLLIHVPNSFFLCIFFGRNVTQFISNDGLKILGIIKTYKITSSFLKIDVFLLCTSTIFSKIIFFSLNIFGNFFPFICSWVILRKKVFLPLKIASLHSICCFGQYPHQWLQPIHNPPFKMSSRWCFGLLTISFLFNFLNPSFRHLVQTWQQ